MAMKVVRQARLELSGGSTPDQLRPPPRAPSLCPADSNCQLQWHLFDSNRPRPLWQPPPTLYLAPFRATSEVPSLLMHPCPPLTPPPPESSRI